MRAHRCEVALALTHLLLFWPKKRTRKAHDAVKHGTLCVEIHWEKFFSGLFSEKGVVINRLRLTSFELLTHGNGVVQAFTGKRRPLQATSMSRTSYPPMYLRNCCRIFFDSDVVQDDCGPKKKNRGCIKFAASPEINGTLHLRRKGFRRPCGCWGCTIAHSPIVLLRSHLSRCAGTAFQKNKNLPPCVSCAHKSPSFSIRCLYKM